MSEETLFFLLLAIAAFFLGKMQGATYLVSNSPAATYRGLIYPEWS